jgi:integrase
MKLTKSAIAKLALPEGKSDHTFYDQELRGFGLRIRKSGKRSFVAVYRIGRLTRRISIGDPARLTPDEARSKAKEILARADLGEDAQLRKHEDARKANMTFKALTNSYLDIYASKRQRPKSLRETRRYLKVHFAKFDELPLHEIERADIAQRLNEIGGYAANRARAALNHFFVWSLYQGYVDQNPVALTAPPTKEVSRSRVLSDSEIVTLWNATEGNGDYHAIVRLLLLTGQRPNEVASMEWRELDLDRCIWSLPPERTKNAKPHDVPLSKKAAEIIAGRHHCESRSLVFGRGSGPFSGWSRSKRRLDAQVNFSSNWRLHDLRRTVVTGMNEIGIAPHIIEAAVNHISGYRGGIAGVYNRAAYAREKSEAMQKWAEHINRLINPA